ncbi:hypothetical protein TNCV_4138661 [Trichonephila clavipes]|nr:hypothetical protein TNCV_4138661 [Trichonephila clavipes]
MFGEYTCNLHVAEILTKVTLLSFEIVTSHNYAPLKSAIHVLETLQDVFFWYGVQKSRHDSLDCYYCYADMRLPLLRSKPLLPCSNISSLAASFVRVIALCFPSQPP